MTQYLQCSRLCEPRVIKIGEKHKIGIKERCFIIAEIGQNHQGDINLAREMIKIARECGADCVKFQKSHLPSKFNSKALRRPYKCPNSWGNTYGEHKAYLEFSEEEFVQLKQFASEVGVLFAASAMDEVSLNFLQSLQVPFIKIGSGDLHNKPLLCKAAKLHVPLIISTGMSNIDEVVDVYNTVKIEHSEFCILHCVSSYPTPLNEINLNVIKTYRKLFPDICIGYSGHELGIETSVAAVALGAKVLERHFTLNKNWKGSDHICSLVPTEFKEMVDSIRSFEKTSNTLNVLACKNIQTALGSFDKRFQVSEQACYEKLGKTIVAARNLNAGEVITADKINIKVSEPKGIPAKLFTSALGKLLIRDIEADESIFESDLILKNA